MPDMLELQYELESKAAKWYATIDIANAFFSIPLAAECRPQFAFTWRGVQYLKPTAPGYIDNIIVWGNTAAEVFEKGKEIIQILLEASFAIKKSKVKRPASYGKFKFKDTMIPQGHPQLQAVSLDLIGRGCGSSSGIVVTSAHSIHSKGKSYCSISL
ncbi:hypothetical protein DUI87_03778 [Hirundo rustica rustica]|uniref:Reverse transcriptase domain-containing protein n=1 Tax=Hirundo rustica rustica TaxID=333673 RepID=A0A3M0L5H9_HIRRU|nr:hypothetical protein DUI87_03778 [Hirundo rustica rustica]